MLTPVVQADALFQMLTRRRELPLEEQGLPERPVRDQTQRAVGFALGEGGELTGDVARRAEFRPHDMKREQPTQHPKELGRVRHLVTQRARTRQ